MFSPFFHYLTISLETVYMFEMIYHGQALTEMFMVISYVCGLFYLPHWNIHF